MLIKWTKDLSVNVKEIDEQHQTFIGLINDLYDATYQMRIKEELSDILKQLKEYAEFHFATEEKYFDKFKYENTEQHKKIHQDLKKDITNFQERFNNGEDIISEFLDFLEDWLVDHLQTEDKKYTQCFNEHGLF